MKMKKTIECRSWQVARGHVLSISQFYLDSCKVFEFAEITKSRIILWSQLSIKSSAVGQVGEWLRVDNPA